MKAFRWLFLLLVLSGSLAACGVSQSTNALRDASRLRAQLVEEGIRPYAAYEFARGEAFLIRAKHAAGHSYHEVAIELAQTARDSFLHAREIARKNRLRRYFRPYRLDWDKAVEP